MSEEKKELNKEDLEKVSAGETQNNDDGKNGLWSNFRVAEDDKTVDNRSGHFYKVSSNNSK